MVRYSPDRRCDDPADVIKVTYEFVLLGHFCKWMIMTGPQALAVHDLQPCHLGEQLVIVANKPAMTAIQGQFALQCPRDLHAAAFSPERKISPLVQVIVKDDEVAHAFVFEPALAVVLVDVRRVEALIGEVGYQARDRCLYQVDACRLQGFEEARREPDCHDVLVPPESRIPVLKRNVLGSASASPSRFASRVAVASSSLM